MSSKAAHDQPPSGARRRSLSGGSHDSALRLKRKRIEDERKQLPIYMARDTIVEELKKNRTLVVVGETGSGKTTQIPQFLHHAGLTKNGAIAITQPRRVAAITISKRVAEEMGTPLGDKVGYSIRFEAQASPQTVIKYVTDGMLLREVLSDGDLSRYSVIILDEAHERTVRTDILFGIIKGIQKRRQDLKVIVMSATLDAKKFSDYFDGAKVLYVAGRQYPVELFFTVEPQPDYLDSIFVTILQLHVEHPPGDILVFLTGQEEIESLEVRLEDACRQLPPEVDKLLICPVFAALPSNVQVKAFSATPPNMRKVVLATNIAETSVTIPGIKFVVDPGVAKARGYNARIGIESLTVQPISKAAARQRSGRAGRESSGTCLRLYTEDTFDTLEENTTPEILRCDLAAVVLQLKSSGIDDVVGFDFLDRPTREALVRGLEQLFSLTALDEKGKITDLGKEMARFPLSPAYARVILQSKSADCLDDVLSVIACLSVDTVFYSPHDKREEAGAAKKLLADASGDHVTLLNVLAAFRASLRDESKGGDKGWCAHNFVSARSMKHILNVDKQLREICKSVGIVPSQGNGSRVRDVTGILKAILSGCFSNTAIRQEDGTYRTIIGKTIVNIHPTSVMFSKRPSCIMYNELVFTTKNYVRGVSAIELSWLTEVAPHYFGRVQRA